MTARFAEIVRPNPLALFDQEQAVLRKNQRRLTARESMLCLQDIYIGLFFDGTGNNKYRDSKRFKHSNVARLYEAYAGAGFAETPSLGRSDGPKTEDLPPAWPKGLDAVERPYYRKCYVPGLGTPFPELGDDGWLDQKLGGGTAYYGDERLDWALLQLANHVHAALMGGKPLQPVLEEKWLIAGMDEYGEHRVPQRRAAAARLAAKGSVA